jgi:hypothetical protein
LDPGERLLLEQASRVADVISGLEAVLEEEGLTASGSRTQKVLHPAVPELRQQRVTLQRLLRSVSTRPDEHAGSSPAETRARRAAVARYRRRHVQAVRRTS